ncbi:MAG TPA: hypothetical protein VFH11_07745 [Gemmatimonadota bacterium]|nr:hypothetical protein [Gemmatimonadota bacterium]
MPELPRYTIRRLGDDGVPAGALYDLPRHGQVALHVDDPELVLLLEAEGLIDPQRPPFLDAAGSGVHGAFRPRPQVNTFLEPPVEAVADAFARAFAGRVYAIEPAGGPQISGHDGAHDPGVPRVPGGPDPSGARAADAQGATG